MPKYWDFRMEGKVGILKVRGTDQAVHSKQEGSGYLHRIPLKEPDQLHEGETNEWLAASQKLLNSSLPDYSESE